MNPREFQQLAVRLSSGNTAAERRTAISRSYYATFNVGAELLRGIGVPLGKGAAAHGEVQRCLANAGNLELATVASQLGDLQTERNRADYQLDRADIERPSKSLAIAMQSSEMIEALDLVFAGPERSKVKTAIEAWRRANGYPV